ncbi:MAG: VWA domain-containing protein [Candidatus Schekmanbacteria bacterium]|nr:VWA domain-containing protein [Candidatus Schekmanbacteria bacterium]
MSKSLSTMNSLFANAAGAGIISQQTSMLLTGSLGNVVVAGAAGKSLEDIDATDVTLITVLLDASSSIGYSRLQQAVRDGYNALLDAFLTSKERDAILMALWIFNDAVKVIHSYVSVADAAVLDRKSYTTSGMTHLYDTWCDALAANIAYAQRLRDGGTPCRSVVVIITDGADVGSRRTARDCAQISRDLLATEEFVLAFVGVGKDVDFHAVARSMGVPDGCIAVQAQATPAALRQVFAMVSQSAILVSQARIAPGANAGFFN